jgi:hypothetical protein
MNRTDSQLKQDIETELRWDRKVNSDEIGVSVDKGPGSRSTMPRTLPGSLRG